MIQLTAGIAHDFNNILTSIIGYTNLSLENCDGKGQEKLRGYLVLRVDIRLEKRATEGYVVFLLDVKSIRDLSANINRYLQQNNISL